MNNRISDPIEIPSTRTLAKMFNLGLPTIQFSKPDYTDDQLKKVNALCKVFGAKLEVRFYGHYGTTFDASVLKSLPDAKWLSIDCLDAIDNIEDLYRHKSLSKLSFGVFNFDDPNFLIKLNLKHLTELRLSDTKKKNIDLAPIGVAPELKTFVVAGHTKNIQSLETSKTIESLWLRSITKKQSLAFVSNMIGLKSLDIMLGGRESINEIAHPKLSELNIVRVRGLKELGDMMRFPKLQQLRIEDQIQLNSLSLKGMDIRALFSTTAKI